ncbi:MAG: cation:proton antiporter [Rhodocyclaceae bacterium]|nr:cation:proton antiporter [Rhodocyclaceae bacterium]
MSPVNDLLPFWPPHSDLFVLAVALLGAALFGESAARFWRLPRILGYTVAGMALGPLALGWLGPRQFADFRVFIDLAVALLLFELGIRVDLRWLRANPAILAGSLAEAGLAFGGVFGVLQWLGVATTLSLAVAAIAIASSPAIALRVSSDCRASGQVTERMLLLTALNMVYALVALHFVLGWLHSSHGRGAAAAFFHPLYRLAGSVLAAVALAFVFRRLRNAFDIADEQASALLFGLLLLVMALLQTARLPTLLAPLLAGMLVKLGDPRPHLFPRHFGSAGSLLVMLMFVFTGALADGPLLLGSAVAGCAVVLVRALAKAAAATALGPLAGLSWRQAGALGLALWPLCGVALGMTGELTRLYPDFGRQLLGILLVAILVMQLLGPVALRLALGRAGETHAERAAPPGRTSHAP